MPKITQLVALRTGMVLLWVWPALFPPHHLLSGTWVLTYLSPSQGYHLALPRPPGSAPGQCDSSMSQLLSQLGASLTVICAALSTFASLAFQPNVYTLDILQGWHLMLPTPQSALIVSVTSAASSDVPAVTSRPRLSQPAFCHRGQHFLGDLTAGLSSRLGQ